MGSFNRSSFNGAHYNRTSSHYADVPAATVTGAGTVPTANMGVSAEATVTGAGTVLPLDWTTSVTATVTLPAVMYYQMIDWVLADIDAAIGVTAEETMGFGISVEGNADTRLKFKFGVSPPEMS
jgi:hypothetical protein